MAVERNNINETLFFTRRFLMRDGLFVTNTPLSIKTRVLNTTSPILLSAGGRCLLLAISGASTGYHEKKNGGKTHQLDEFFGTREMGIYCLTFRLLVQYSCQRVRKITEIFLGRGGFQAVTFRIRRSFSASRIRCICSSLPNSSA